MQTTPTLIHSEPLGVVVRFDPYDGAPGNGVIAVLSHHERTGEPIAAVILPGTALGVWAGASWRAGDHEPCHAGDEVALAAAVQGF